MLGSEELAMHPTVKPVVLIADEIRDCSRRGGVVLGCFGGATGRNCWVASFLTGAALGLGENSLQGTDYRLNLAWARFRGDAGKWGDENSGPIRV